MAGLPEPGMLDDEELVEVVRAAQRDAWLAGERPMLESYLERYPQLLGAEDALLDLVYAEVILRERMGQRPAESEYLERFPQIEARIRRQFEVHRAIADLGDATALEPDGAGGGGVNLETLREVDVRLRSDGEPPPRGDGSRIGRHTRSRQLGRGGMGAVYLVRDEEIGRDLAAKVLLDRFAGHSPLELRRFLTEAKVTGQLEHPNIVPVHELGLTDEGRLFFTMKRIRGQTLGAVLAQERPLVELLNIFLKVCDAIAYAHDRGVLHRDLKPDNVMVGAFGDVQVVDWGLARLLDSVEEEAVEVSLGVLSPAELDSASAEELETMAGTVVGTPGFMPPEQAAGELDQLDERADVYSLGAVLYQMLTLEYPIPMDIGVGMVLKRTIQGKLIPPTQRTPERAIPWELEAIVMKAMARDPADRYRSVGEISADVLGFIEGRTISAATYNPWQVLRKWVGRHKVFVGATSAVLIAAIAFTGWLAWRRIDRDRRVERLRAEAEAAYSAGRFSDALGLSARALTFKGDIPLERLATLCREKIAEEAERASAAYRYRILQQRLRPYGRLIDETRPYFYIAKVDIGGKLAQLRSVVTRLEELARDPAHADAADLWVMLGTGWFFVGHMGRAEKALGRAVALSPDEPVANYYLGRINLRRSVIGLLRSTRTGRRDAARSRRSGELARRCFERSERGGRISSRQIDAHLVGTYLLVAQDRKPEATRRCREGLERFAGKLGREEYWHMLAWLGDPRSARRALDNALEIRPHDAWLRMLRGMIHVRADRDEAAKADYDAAVRLNPYSARALCNRAALFTKQRKYRAALADFDAAVALDPDDYEARAMRGNLKRLAGDFDGALADYTAALGMAPGVGWLYSGRGLVHFTRRKFALALADYEKAVKLDPRDASAMLNVAFAQNALGRYPASLRSLGRTIELDPRMPEAYAMRALIHQAFQRYAEAMADFDTAIKLAPKHFTARYNRGLLRQAQGKLAEAEADLTVAVEAQPRMVAAWIQRGLVRAARKNYEGAFADTSRAIALEPRNVAALVNRGLIRARMGQLREAIEDYDRALAIAPETMLAWYNRGVANIQLGRTAQARRDLRRAQRLATPAQRRQIQGMLDRLK